MKFRWAILIIALLAARASAQQEAPAFSLAWAQSNAMEGVRAVYPHGSDPRVAWATTAEGLWRTDDEGRTWHALPQASAEKIGPITSLAVCPADSDRLVAGTAENGCWLSIDGGATWQKLGQGDTRPAADQIAAVAFGTRDLSWSTLFVTHGQAKAGMSISRDLGKTWEVVGTDRYFGAVAFSGWTIIAAASMTETDGKTWGLHRSIWDGQRWEETFHGAARPVDGGETLLPPHVLFFSTLDGKILVSSDDGQTWRDRAPEGSGHWVSVFATRGATQKAEVLAAYNPEKLGVMLSEIRFKDETPAFQNRGLRINPFVKSGASCRANANGLTWYIVMNDALWIGRRLPRSDAPTIAQARCEPATITLDPQGAAAAEDELQRRLALVAAGAADVDDADVKALAAAGKTLQATQQVRTIQVLVQVTPTKDAAIKSVTVDLTAAGGAASTELFDDGQHGDGQANDGLWGCQGSFTAHELPENDRRFGVAGHICPMTVTVTDAAGHRDNRTAMLTAYVRLQPLQLVPHGMNFHGFREIASESAVASEVRMDRSDALLRRVHRPRALAGRLGCAEGPLPVAGYQWLQLDIRGTPNQDVNVHLADYFQRGQDFMDVPHLSAGVPVVAGGYLKAVTGEFQTVRIPIGKLLPPGTLFMRQYATGLALSAKDGGPCQYELTNIRLLP